MNVRLFSVSPSTLTKIVSEYTIYKLMYINKYNRIKTEII